MEFAFNDTNPECLEEIAAAYRILEDAGRTSTGYSLLTEVFKLKDRFKNPTAYDVITLNLAIFDAFQGIVQYTYDGMNVKRQAGGPATVSNVCEIFTKKKATNDKEYLQKLYEVYLIPHTDKDGKVDEVFCRFDDYLKDFLNDSYSGRKFFQA